jgi:Lon protease-like protein
MSLLEDFSFSCEDFAGTVRLFPLPNLVLFPHVMQPLHVFEPRYRALLEAALAGDRLVTMALLRPGWQRDYEGRPPLYPAACLGRVAAHHRLEDGSYNLLLVGLRRVRLVRELPPTKRYREAHVEVFEDQCPPAQDAHAADLKQRLRGAFFRILPDLPEAADALDQLLCGEVSLGALTDMVSYVLDIDLEAKLALLAEVNVHRRAELLLGHLEACAADTTPGRYGENPFPPDFGVN